MNSQSGDSGDQGGQSFVPSFAVEPTIMVKDEAILNPDPTSSPEEEAYHALNVSSEERKSPLSEEEKAPIILRSAAAATEIQFIDSELDKARPRGGHKVAPSPNEYSSYQSQGPDTALGHPFQKSTGGCPHPTPDVNRSFSRQIQASRGGQSSSIQQDLAQPNQIVDEQVLGPRNTRMTNAQASSSQEQPRPNNRYVVGNMRIISDPSQLNSTTGDGLTTATYNLQNPNPTRDQSEFNVTTFGSECSTQLINLYRTGVNMRPNTPIRQNGNGNQSIKIEENKGTESLTRGTLPAEQPISLSGQLRQMNRDFNRLEHGSSEAYRQVPASLPPGINSLRNNKNKDYLLSNLSRRMVVSKQTSQISQFDHGGVASQQIVSRAPRNSGTQQAYINVQIGDSSQQTLESQKPIQLPLSYPQAPYGTQSQSIQELHTIDEVLDQGERLVMQQKIEFDNFGSSEQRSPDILPSSVETRLGSQPRNHEEYKIEERVIGDQDRALNAPINTINCRSPPSMSSPIRQIRESTHLDPHNNSSASGQRRYVLPLVSRVSIDNYQRIPVPQQPVQTMAASQHSYQPPQQRQAVSHVASVPSEPIVPDIPPNTSTEYVLSSTNSQNPRFSAPMSAHNGSRIGDRQTDYVEFSVDPSFAAVSQSVGGLTTQAQTSHQGQISEVTLSGAAGLRPQNLFHRDEMFQIYLQRPPPPSPLRNRNIGGFSFVQEGELGSQQNPRSLLGSNSNPRSGEQSAHFRIAPDAYLSNLNYLSNNESSEIDADQVDALDRTQINTVSNQSRVPQIHSQAITSGVQSVPESNLSESRHPIQSLQVPQSQMRQAMFQSLTQDQVTAQPQIRNGNILIQNSNSEVHSHQLRSLNASNLQHLAQTGHRTGHNLQRDDRVFPSITGPRRQADSSVTLPQVVGASGGGASAQISYLPRSHILSHHGHNIPSSQPPEQNLPPPQRSVPAQPLTHPIPTSSLPMGRSVANQSPLEPASAQVASRPLGGGENEQNIEDMLQNLHVSSGQVIEQRLPQQLQGQQQVILPPTSASPILKRVLQQVTQENRLLRERMLKFEADSQAMKAQIQSLQEVMIEHSKKCPLLVDKAQHEGVLPLPEDVATASPRVANARVVSRESRGQAPENVVSQGESPTPAEEGKIKASERGGASKASR